MLRLAATVRNFSAQLAEWRVRFTDRIRVDDAPVSLAYGEILATARREGRPMSAPDAQISAIAHRQICRLATRNTQDVCTAGLLLINP
jgi:predicted nucleic acid-binding protein